MNIHFLHPSLWPSYAQGPPSGAFLRWMRHTGFALALAFPLWTPTLAQAEDKPVSYYRDLVPIFKRSCTGCHHPGKLKGQLDLTTYALFQKGGKHGPAFKPGQADESRVIEEVSGEEPNMPKEGDPLSQEEVALFERWIKEGAKDDT